MSVHLYSWDFVSALWVKEPLINGPYSFSPDAHYLYFTGIVRDYHQKQRLNQCFLTLERIREIRASERKLYQKITDLYATAIDYDKNAAATRRFYATVQNKMHYAV